jgi:hypothetical protein
MASQTDDKTEPCIELPPASPAPGNATNLGPPQQSAKPIDLLARFKAWRLDATTFRPWPSHDFWKDFWPAFWATAIGVVFSIPSGLYLDRVIKHHAAAKVLPFICRELKESKSSLQTFGKLPNLPRDAVGRLGSPLRTIRTSFTQSGFQDVDDPRLVGAISGAYASLDEVNKYLSLYRSAYATSPSQTPSTEEVLLSNTSDESLRMVDYAIEEITRAEGSAACQ